MFTYYSDVPLFYDRAPRYFELEQEYRHYVGPGDFGWRRSGDYGNAYRQSEIRRYVRGVTEAALKGRSLGSRLGALLEEVDCRLRRRVLHQPCAEHIRVR